MVPKARVGLGRGLGALGFCAAMLVPGPIFPFQLLREPVVRAPTGLRVLVLERDEPDASAWGAIRDLGANAVAISRPPSAEIDRLAGDAGLTYLALLTTDEISTLAADASRISEVRAEHALAGFYYWDSQVLEGFTTPEAQQQAYSTLKLLFPDKLVLYPTRLDPIAWSPDFLDRYFRPEFTDLVTPYFYPVGTTILGPAREGDAWQGRLGELLSALASRIPSGKGLLPVLQGFEQEGYPVSSHFLTDQFASYRRSWPNVPNAAVFAWELASPDSAPLIEIAGRPDLEQGVCNLFRGLWRRSCRTGPFVSWR
jgi:hypothetical protein